MKPGSLKDYLGKAKKEGWALAHFNFCTIDQLHAIVQAAQEELAPVLVGTAEKELRFFGAEEAAALVSIFRKRGVAVFLNADHCTSVQSAMVACEAGYDSVHIDLSKKSFEENMKGTKEVVEFVKKKRPEVLVEGELGYIVTDASKVYREKIVIPEDSYPKVEEAVRFVQETGINLLAPAVGTIHGIVEGAPFFEELRMDLISKLSQALPGITLVLHGGSGVSQDQVKRAIRLGMNSMHISTDLRVAYRNALEAKLQKDKDAMAPYSYLEPAAAAVKQLVKDRLIMSGASGRVKA